MLKLTPFAEAQPVQLTNSGKERVDAHQNPLRTIYLRANKGQRYSQEQYLEIAQFQLNFYDKIEEIIAVDTAWCRDIGLFNLPRILNDPKIYTIRNIIDDTRKQYQLKHDPCLSIIIRQNWLVEKLMSNLNPEGTGLAVHLIDCQFKNPDLAALKKLHQLRDYYDFSWYSTEPKDTLFEVTQ